MSGSDKQQASSADEVEYGTESDEEPQEQPVQLVASKAKTKRKTQQRLPTIPADEVEYETESDEEPQEQPVQLVASKAKTKRKTQQRLPTIPAQVVPEYNPAVEQQVVPVQDQRLTGNMGGRTDAIRKSRIKDRPKADVQRDSSLKIKIELDLEVEVDLYARVKGDISIGLM